MKNSEPIIIVAGEPNSIFLEIYFKAIRYKKYDNPLILIASKKILIKQMKKLNYKMKIKDFDYKKFDLKNIDNNSVNLINVNFNQLKAFEKITSKSNTYIKKSFHIAFEIIKQGFSKKLINGPISKKTFLKKNYLGITEFLKDKFNSKSNAMLIYNKNLSVCPITTHLPIKQVTKNINKKLITEKVILVNNFYKKILGFTPKIAVLGLNPHCESIDKFNEDDNIVKPTIKILKKKYKIDGPIPADTIFIKNIRKKYDVVIGMYHDQVLSPIKALYEYDAINITLGLPFIRISPDHGPNEKMLGKNSSNPLSLIQAINFLDKN